MCQQSRAGELRRNVTIRDRLTVQDYSWLCLCCLLLNADIPWMLWDCYFWESLIFLPDLTAAVYIVNTGQDLNCAWLDAALSIFLLCSFSASLISFSNYASHILESSGRPLGGARWLTFWIESEQRQPPVSSLSQPIWPLSTNPCNN